MFLYQWLFYAVLCTGVIYSNSSAFVSGLLTILLYFLAFVLYAFTLRPEDAENAGHYSGTYLGEQLVMKDNFFLSFSFFLEILSCCFGVSKCS